MKLLDKLKDLKIRRWGPSEYTDAKNAGGGGNGEIDYEAIYQFYRKLLIDMFESTPESERPQVLTYDTLNECLNFSEDDFDEYGNKQVFSVLPTKWLKSNDGLFVVDPFGLEGNPITIGMGIIGSNDA